MNAHNAPAIREKQPLLSGLQWVVLVVGLLILACYASSSIEAKRRQTIEDSAQQQVAHGEASFQEAIAALKTPAAFEARCGRATWHRAVDGHAALIYDEPIAGEPPGEETLSVAFGYRAVTYLDTLHGHHYRLSARDALASLGCKF